MRIIIIIFIVLTLASNASLSWAQTNGSGLPLPRFVSLRAAEVNMRTGPGVQYPVEWVYRRQSLPMEVIAEYGTWRKVRDWQGTQGWVHQSMLSGRRAMIVTGKVRTVRGSQSTKSAAIAKVEPGVIGQLVECPREGSWCRIDVDGREGWLRRVEFWGIYRSEALE
jgi:SH3-like domain-containing protein